MNYWYLALLWITAPFWVLGILGATIVIWVVLITLVVEGAKWVIHKCAG